MRHDPPQSVRRLERQDAPALGALPDEELHALACLRRAGHASSTGRACSISGKRSDSGCPSGTRPEPEIEATIAVASQHAVLLQRRGQAVSGHARDPRRLLQLRQSPRTSGHRTQHDHRLVEDADARYAIHIARSVSHILGHAKQRGATTWARHCRRRCGNATWCTPAPDEPDLLYIDLHLVHEVTSPQAFEGLRLHRSQGPPTGPDDRHGRPQRAHRDSTAARSPIRLGQTDRHSAGNTAEFGITNFDLGDATRASCT